MERVISRSPRGLLGETVLSLFASITHRRNEFISVKDKPELLEAFLKQQLHSDGTLQHQQHILCGFKFKYRTNIEKATDKLDKLMSGLIADTMHPKELISGHDKLDGIHGQAEKEKQDMSACKTNMEERLQCSGDGNNGKEINSIFTLPAPFKRSEEEETPAVRSKERQIAMEEGFVILEKSSLKTQRDLISLKKRSMTSQSTWRHWNSSVKGCSKSWQMKIRDYLRFS